MTVNIHEAKTNLSKLIALLEKGEDIIIAKAGNPIAKLISYRPSNQRTPNLFKGKIEYHEDFDSSNEEIADLFEGEVH
jgi:prevent-host-death family protein